MIDYVADDFSLHYHVKKWNFKNCTDKRPLALSPTFSVNSNCKKHICVNWNIEIIVQFCVLLGHRNWYQSFLSADG